MADHEQEDVTFFKFGKGERMPSSSIPLHAVQGDAGLRGRPRVFARGDAAVVARTFCFAFRALTFSHTRRSLPPQTSTASSSSQMRA